MKINVCGIGDPKNPRTWSRTPYNITQALEKNNNLDKAFSTDSKTVFTNFLKLIESLYYRLPVSWERRGKIVRNMNAQRSINKTRRADSSHTLHFGTGDLPFKKLPKDQHHYIYCDSTWDLWISNTIKKSEYSKKIVDLSERLERICFQQVDHIFSVSHYVKENLMDHYGLDNSKITVVGTGRGIITPYYGKKDYSNGKILFVAKDRFEEKGGFILLDAFIKASEVNPKLQLTIVGRDNKTAFKHPNITFHGHLSQKKLQNLFNSHSLFVMPALNEPWGLVYLEAMACKMPIVGIYKNSFPELSDYGKNGFGMLSPNPEELAGILIRLTSDSQKMQEIGQRAQAFALQFNWENTVYKIMQKLDHSVNGNGDYFFG